ncbi:MAG: hypothetical protein HKM94_07725 [Halobacteria archaeon]|nr:hypothetical protein [Halobacteria archaeon]
MQSKGKENMVTIPPGIARQFLIPQGP